MNPVHSFWWRLLDDARFGVRYLCARYSRLGTWGIFLRWLFHLIAGNPFHVLAVVVVSWSPLGSPAAPIVLALVVLLFEFWYQIFLVTRRGSWMHGWRLWWRVRRSLPAEWAESSVKSKSIKSSFGGENRSSSSRRPIADHPKTAWFPKVEWPVVSVWCGHPPGRTTGAFVEFQRVLAANILRVDDVQFDFARDRDSVGRLQLTFVDVLATPVAPVDAVDLDDRVVVDSETGEVIRRLRLVRDWKGKTA